LASTTIAKRGLDPALVERFTSAAARLCAPLDEPSPWATALAAEPERRAW